jgi:hypothetical protein
MRIECEHRRASIVVDGGADNGTMTHMHAVKHADRDSPSSRLKLLEITNNDHRAITVSG